MRGAAAGAKQLQWAEAARDKGAAALAAARAEYAELMQKYEQMAAQVRPPASALRAAGRDCGPAAALEEGAHL